MSTSGVPSPQNPSRAASPDQSRHHIHPSISEIASPGRLGRRHVRNLSRNRHKRDASRNESVAPQGSVSLLQSPARRSLEVPKPEGITPGSASLNASRRPSISMADVGQENIVGVGISPAAFPGQPATKLSKQEELRRERERASARTTGLKKSLVELDEFSTSTTPRRLDEAYYGVLEKLSALQTTIVGLRDLAGLSASMNEGFIKESKEVAADAQEQLDAFGQFDAQQEQIQTLQERIYSGRERIAALSSRVDVVRRKIDGWERADRTWQERTRRRLKTLWIIFSAVALVLLLLFVGARAYAPELEQIAREVRDETLAKMGKDPVNGSLNGTGRDEFPVSLNFSSKGMASAEDALRALDEL